MSLTVSIIDGMTNATDDDLSGFQTDFLLPQAGYTDLPQYTTPFQVTASGTPDKNSNVAAGVYYIPNSTSSPVQQFRIVNTATITTLHSDPSANPRIDAVVLFLDLGAAAGPDGESVASIEIVEGSEAGSPTAPSDGDITTALGASTWARLADIDIAYPFVSISSGDITDQRSEIGIAGDKIIYPSGQKITDYEGWTNWTPVYSGFSADPSGVISRYMVVDKMCTVAVRMPADGTSDSTSFTMTAPFTSANIDANMQWSTGTGGIVNNGTGETGGIVRIDNNSQFIRLMRNGSITGWTNSGGKRATFMLTYEIA